MTQERPLHELKVAKTQDEIESCYQMRIEVFSVEQGFPLETEIDEYDPVSIHFILTTPVPLEEASTSLSALLPSSTPAQEQKQTSKPIGTIRFVPQLGKITRLVVLKDYRSFGFGKVLMEGVEGYLAKLKQGDLERFGTVREDQGKTYITVKIHSQLQVEKFYAKFGYKPVGPQFDEEGELHQKMIKDIEINA